MLLIVKKQLKNYFCSIKIIDIKQQANERFSK